MSVAFTHLKMLSRRFDSGDVAFSACRNHNGDDGEDFLRQRSADTIEWVNKGAFAPTAIVQGGWAGMLPVKKSGSITVDRADDHRLLLPLTPNVKAASR